MSERRTCEIRWGCCPEHGATLTRSGDVAWCHVPGCGRQWPAEHFDAPCDEPAVYTLRDMYGSSAAVCRGHAIDAREHLIGGTLELLITREGL